MRPVLPVIGVVIFGLFLVEAFSQPISDLWWDATHRCTASYEQYLFRIPLGWRQREVPAGLHRVELRNASREVLRFRQPDRIDIREAQVPFNAGEAVLGWERFQTQTLVPGERLEPTPKNPFLLKHYRCSNVERSPDQRIILTCFDREGQWIVSYRGRQVGIQDLSAIMQSVSLRSESAR